MFTLFAVISCALLADAKLVPRIFNGNNALVEQYPYQVSIDYDSRHVCGGSIIAKHYVLTAAHCRHSDPEDDKLYIRAGSSFPGKGGSLHKVVEFINHKGYSIDKHYAPIHDIAIIKVKEPFEYDDTCRAIELFGGNEEAKPGVKAVVTGYGLVNVTHRADQLQAAELTIISKKACKKAHNDVLFESQICALGSHGRGACTGDSGGPIAIDGRLAGVVSWGRAECDPEYPSVYTEVADYHDWIDEYVQFE